MSESFSITYDYRCPFARNAHEHVVAGLEEGADWEVDFVPFSLSQAHVEEGGTPVWDAPQKAHSLTAVEVGLVVKEQWPDRFLAVHLALFAARHDQGRDLRSDEVLREVLESSQVDANSVFESISTGWPRDEFRKAHEAAVAEHHVFGVPTFVVADSAVFVRLMTRPTEDRRASIEVVELVLKLLKGHLELNEFKHTTIPH